MRQSSIIEMLEYEAKRRPAVAELVARIPDMTVDEIETVKVPLPWYRQALKQMRRQYEHGLLSDEIDLHVSDRYQADPDGWMCTYTGETAFIHIDRGSQLQVETGTLVFFPKKGGVWIDLLFSGKLDEYLKACCRVVKETTLTNYKQARSDQRTRNCPPDAPVIDMTGKSATEKTVLGSVRIGPVGG